MRRLVPPLLLLSSISLPAWAADSPRQIPPDPSIEMVGQPIPDIPLTDVHGQPWNPAHLDAKPAVLYFWARWCRACVTHLPELTRLQAELPQATFYAVSVDRDPALAGAITSRLPDFTVPVVLDSKALLLGQLDAAAMPLLVVLDSQAVVRAVLPGYRGAETDTILKETLDGIR